MTIKNNHFKVYMMNNQGIETITYVGELFDHLLIQLEYFCDKEGRDFSIVKTKLEEACFYAKRSCGLNPKNNLMKE